MIKKLEKRESGRLCDSIFRELPASWRFEAKHDMILGYATLNQVLGDAVFGAVQLNPDLVAPDFDVNQAAVHSPHVFPALDDTQINFGDIVKDRFARQIHNFSSGMAASSERILLMVCRHCIRVLGSIRRR